MTEDATLVDSTSGDISLDIQTPAEPSRLSPVKSASALSPIKSASPMKVRSPTKGLSPVKKEHSRSPEKAGSRDSSTLDREDDDAEVDGEVNADGDQNEDEHDSIFGGPDDEGDAQAEDEDMSKDSPAKEDVNTSPQKIASPVKKTQETSEDSAPPIPKDEVDYGYLYTVGVLQMPLR